MSDLIIRNATPDDMPSIVRFQQAMALESEGIKLDPEILGEGVEAVFEDPSKGFYRVAEHSGELVACHMITIEWSDWRNASIWWIQSLYVSPDYRKKGIFKKMFNTLKAMVDADATVAGIRLYVDNRNETARAVYDAVGMDGEHYTTFEWMKP